jgi:hypothetical protein
MLNYKIVSIFNRIPFMENDKEKDFFVVLFKRGIYGSGAKLVLI